MSTRLLELLMFLMLFTFVLVAFSMVFAPA